MSIQQLPKFARKLFIYLLLGLGFGYIAESFGGFIAVTGIYLALFLIVAWKEKFPFLLSLLATSFLSIQFFFAEPKFSFSVRNFEAWLLMVAYLFIGLIFYSLVRFVKDENHIANDQLKFLQTYFATILLTTILWISRKFENPSIEQFIFHFEFSDQLFDDFDHSLFENFLKDVIVSSTVISSFLLLLSKLIDNLLKNRLDSLTTKVLRFFMIKNLPLVLILASSIVATLNFGISQYLTFKNSNEFYQENYVSPNTLNISLAKPKNLILIYVESLETGYRDPSLFGKNLLQSLDSIPGEEFQHYTQTPGTGWTIAAIVSTQCGIPLKPVALAEINVQGSLLKKFLPNVTCLGDTLKKFGYNNVFLGGASPSFSGKGKFLSSHGYGKVYGREYWKSIGYSTDDMSSWGLHDDVLLKEARNELDRLYKNTKPFNLTILTLDTHFPKGHLSTQCKAAGGLNLDDIVSCTSSNIAQFIQYAEVKGYLKNTNVVILGDHLSMSSTTTDRLKTKPRYIFNKWISKDHFIPNRSAITHFSIAPTILEFIGFDLPNLRYGLGRSGFYQLKDFSDEEFIKRIFNESQYPSSFYESFWLDKRVN